MGIFNFFKRKTKDLDVEDKNDDDLITYVEQDDATMVEAYEKAQSTFPYFWRELSWEYRRIVPALSIASVKASFSEDVEGEDDPIVEHMWINDIYFDGEMIYGTLINEPNDVTNVKVGDQVMIKVSDVDDWLLSDGEKVCGGFSVQAIRKLMNDQERKEHDNAWGLPFSDDYSVSVMLFDDGDHDTHPMDQNMAESLGAFLAEHPNELTDIDNVGNTMLIRETIAGNLTSVKVLLEKGADVSVRNNYGKNALDYAKAYGWTALADLLQYRNATVH